jgi:hypothetical protein
VSTLYHQFEGARATGTGQRAITATTANTITTSAAIVGLAVGDVVEAFGTPTAGANDGFYDTLAIAGAVITVTPALAVQGAGGTAARLVQLATKVASGAVTTFEAGNVIHRVGALFETLKVRPGDRAVVRLSTSNTRSWFVQRVISEDRIEVRPLDGGPALVVEAVGTSVLIVREGGHRVRMIDETTTSGDLIRSGGVSQVNSSGGQMGSGPIARLLEKFTTVGGGTPGGLAALFLLFGIHEISIEQTGATSTTWQSNNEIWVSMRSTTFAQVALRSIGDVAGLSVITLGLRPGDRYSSRNGSVWIGIQPNDADIGAGRLAVSVRGSWFQTSTFRQVADCMSSIIRAGLNPFGGGDIESVVNYTTVTTLVALGVPTTSENLLVGQLGTAQGVIVGDQVFEGLLLTADVTIVPLRTLSGNTIEIRNPRAMYAIEQLVDVNTGGVTGTGIITFTYNPRFVSANPGLLTPQPVAGLTVRIWEINEATDVETEVAGSPFTSEASGRINGGAGVILRADSMTSPATVGTDFSARLEVTGPGVNMGGKFGLRAKHDFDIVVMAGPEELLSVAPATMVLAAPVATLSDGTQVPGCLEFGVVTRRALEWTTTTYRALDWTP